MADTEKLRRAVTDFCAFIRGLPAGALVEKAWGPKEVLAHEVFWVESYVAQLGALLAGESPLAPAGRFEDLNTSVIAASREVTVEALLHRLQRATEQFCAYAQPLDGDQVQFSLTKGGVQHTLNWFIRGETGHLRDHLHSLERQTSRAYLADVDKLRQAVDNFCRFLRDLPGVSFIEGPKQVLAHLVVCHETHVAQIEAIQAQAPFTLPRGQAMDARIAAHCHLSLDNLVSRFQAADAQLRAFAQTLDPQNFVLEVWRLELKRGSYFRTLDDVVAWAEIQIRQRHKKTRQLMTDKENHRH